MKTVIVAARRTPIGTFLESFADFSAVVLGSVAAKAVLGNLPPKDIAPVPARTGDAFPIDQGTLDSISCRFTGAGV